VGLVEVNNITIGWPKRRHNKGSAPLAEIVEQTSADDDGLVKHLKSIHASSYSAGYNILTPGQEYTIVAAGMKVYHGLGQWHAITQCGVKLRMGKSLKKVWETWRRIYLGAEV
jgi:hypothetical protein